MAMLNKNKFCQRMIPRKK